MWRQGVKKKRLRDGDSVSPALSKCKAAKISSEITLQMCSPETLLKKKTPIYINSSPMAYWKSPEAYKLFNVASDENVYEVLQDRVKSLQYVNKYVKGYKDIVQGHDLNHMCSDYDIMILKQKCSYLCLSYVYALKYMNKWAWIQECCKKAAKSLSLIGYDIGTNAITISIWNREFRTKEQFQHPNIYARHGKLPTPIIFDIFPEAHNMLIK